ncbi:hypothetical protein Nepgr_026452 [Nepenthes gracilis]|uniref:Large ribosomal subunit protein bL25 beta domain-containing protein n=1 Tax=Nepenthes gracilis TaxID=150966 RepID=A0AAD3T8G3_NEPGR|nr:hypothetical protein Nepgr_026452 [Nepenthes gracilis]
MLPWWRTAGERLRSAVANSRPFHTIQAIPREVTGSRVAARERAQGRIPAVVFTQQFTPAGPEGVATRSISRKHLLTIERKQIHSILKSIELDFFCSTAFKLQIRAGSGSSMLLESGNVLPIKIHRDEETGKILNLVFVWADEGSKLAVDVPVVFKGKEICPGLKKGGHLQEIRSSLKFLCPADQIPQKIEVDISNLDIGDRILLHDIKVDSSLKLLSKNSTKPVIKIVAMNVGNPGTLS